VTVLDYETETLKGPPYSPSGRFIDEILALKKTFPEELTYVSHVLYCLFDIGLKSCLYYHLCCVGVGEEAVFHVLSSIPTCTFLLSSRPLWLSYLLAGQDTYRV